MKENFIKTFTRLINSKEQEILKKYRLSLISKNKKNKLFVTILCLLLIFFCAMIYLNLVLWLSIFYAFISLLIAWQVYGDIQNIINFPKEIESFDTVIKEGQVKVKQYNIESFLLIKTKYSNSDFIISDGENSILLQSIFLQNHNKLKSRIELISIYHPNNNRIFHEDALLYGNLLEASRVINLEDISNFSSVESWDELMNGEVVKFNYNVLQN